MTEQETEAIRRDVRKLMIDHGLERNRVNLLQDALRERTGKPVSRANIGYALTGHRKTKAYHAMLVELKQILEAWPPDRAA